MNICKICGNDFDRLSSHVKRTHGLEYENYLIKYIYNDIRPLCACGCGQETFFTKSQGESFKKFIHGHHAKGRKKSDEEKVKIGKKNSENMKKFLSENPDILKERIINIQIGKTEETERKRILSIKKYYENYSEEERLVKSNVSKLLWKENREMMLTGVGKAKETWKENHKNGLHKTGTEEWKDKISLSVTEKYLEGGFEWSRGKHTSDKLTGKQFAYYRSSWELRHMKNLDEDTSVVSYQYEPFVIRYDYENRKRRYIPDFLVKFDDGRVELQEIGVKMLKKNERNLAKITAAKKFCEDKSWIFKVISFE